MIILSCADSNVSSTGEQLLCLAEYYFNIINILLIQHRFVVYFYYFGRCNISLNISPFALTPDIQSQLI